MVVPQAGRASPSSITSGMINTIKKKIFVCPWFKFGIYWQKVETNSYTSTFHSSIIEHWTILLVVDLDRLHYICNGCNSQIYKSHSFCSSKPESIVFPIAFAIKKIRHDSSTHVHPCGFIPSLLGMTFILHPTFSNPPRVDPSCHRKKPCYSNNSTILCVCFGGTLLGSKSSRMDE